MHWKDPGVQAEWNEVKKFVGQKGRQPKDDAELREFLEQEHKNWQREFKEREAHTAKEREEKRNWEIEREKILGARRRARTAAVPSPRTIINLETLEEAAKAEQSNCEGAIIEGTGDNRVFIGLDLELFNFRGAEFRYVTFVRRANLKSVIFDHAKFENVIFEAEADLQGADFGGAELTEVRFEEGCKLEGANFQFADFRTGMAIEFDRNYLSNATFQTVRKDKWFQFSNAYTGVFQFVNLTLSGAYFGFILVKLYLFKAMVATQSFLSTLPLVEAHRDKLANVSFTTVSVFRFVFGSFGISLIIAMIILCYQAMRFYLTMRIGPLIDSEQRTGCTPLRSSYEGYLTLHGFSRVLGVIAILLFVYELWELFSQPPLLVPKSVVGPS